VLREVMWQRNVRARRRFSQRENKWSKEHDQFDTSKTRKRKKKERESERGGLSEWEVLSIP